MSEAKTVRVRIAVAVNAEGDWVSRGDSSHGEWSRQYVEDDADEAGMGACATVWIEADVPLPQPVTVEGEVSK